MCILGLVLNAREDLDFVAVHNREEDLRRPTADPDPQNPIVCCTDLRAGGTWMGFNRMNGNFVALTNYRRVVPENPENPTSRGLLVTKLLNGPTKPEELENTNQLDLQHDFAGFNLVFVNLFEPSLHNVKAITNRPGPPHASHSQTANHRIAAVYQLQGPSNCTSNYFIDNDTWPKVAWLKQALLDKVKEIGAIETEEDEKRVAQALLELMTTHNSFPSDSLPSDCHLSLLPEAEERYHQQGVFVPIVEGHYSATMTQTVVFRTRKHVWYCARDVRNGTTFMQKYTRNK